MRQAHSKARAQDLAPLIWKAIAEGNSYRIIADQFNESGIAPPRRAPWTKNSIWRIAGQTAAAFRQGSPGKRIGTAQNKVRKRLGEIGPLLLTWRVKAKPIVRSPLSSDGAASSRLGVAIGDRRRSDAI